VGTFASSLVVQVCSLLAGVVVARLLGPTGRGQLAAAMLWPTCFAALGLVGVDVAIARRAGRGGDLPALSRTAVVVGAVTAGVSAAIAWLLIPQLLPAQGRDLVPLAIGALVLIPINHIVMSMQAVELGAGRLGLYNASRAVLYPAYLFALAGMWVLQLRSVAWVIAAQLASNAVVLVLLVGSRRKELIQGRTLVEPLAVVREGLRFGVVTIGNMVHQRIDQILLLWLLPVQDLGLYVVGLSAASVVGSAAGSMAVVCFTHAAQAGPSEGFPIIARDFRRAGILCAGAGLAAIPALPLVLPLFYGQEFARSSHVAMTIVAGSVLAGMAQILDQALRGQGRPYAGLAGRGLAIAVVAAIGSGLTPVLGLLGMAVAFVASQLTYVVVLASSAVSHYRDARWGLLVPRTSDFTELWGAARGYVLRSWPGVKGSRG
jgi:O-antigen/teichoic acid export membrane protein